MSHHSAKAGPISTFLMGVCLFSASLSRAQDVPATVEVALVSNQVYAGETPRLKITITASKQAVAVVKDEETIHMHRCLYANLFDSKGERVAGGLPSIQPTKLPNDYIRLEPGKSLTLEYTVLSRPPKTGSYVLRLQFTPTPDEKFVVAKELPLKAVDIDQNTVLDRVVLKVPDNPHRANTTPETLELLNVKTQKGHELIYRLVRKTEAGPVPDVKRLLPLDETSRITAVPKFFDRREYIQRFWVAYNKGGELYCAQLEYVTGKVLDHVQMERVFKVQVPKE